MNQKLGFDFNVKSPNTKNSKQSKMENTKFSLKEMISEDAISINKIKCSKRRGSGNFKTPEN